MRLTYSDCPNVTLTVNRGVINSNLYIKRNSVSTVLLKALCYNRIKLKSVEYEQSLLTTRHLLTIINQNIDFKQNLSLKTLSQCF